MRYINLEHLSRLRDLSELEALSAEVRTLPSAQRPTFLNDHDDACATIRTALWALGACKCWYSEAQLQEQQGHVEHYRPRRRLHGAGHTGYWWRAFDWSNLRLAHPTVNLRVTDYLTGKKVGKGSYFPLANESERAEDEVNEGLERPLLLDPVAAADCKLLCFDSSNGRPVPRYSVTHDELRHSRAATSIDYFHLDEATWNKNRKDLMDDVAILCDRILEAAGKGAAARTELEARIDELLGYLDSFAEFSSAANQVAREKGVLEHVYPVPV
jgi:hypothetical protein